MAFVKLDCGILNSTIWYDKAARDVFLTALLLAQPAVFDEPVRQIHVDRIEHTGWSAPPGWYGLVPACGAAIIGRAMADEAEGYEALRRLGEPEPTSRSPEFGGRRLIRVDGGYLVLNYMKHREKDHTAAERSRRYRERQTSRASHRELDASRRDITQAEAEIRSSEKETLFESKETPAAPSPTSKRKRSLWPEDFRPNAKHAELAAKHRVDLSEELETCADHWRSKGELRANWDATFSNWLRRARTFAPKGKPSVTRTDEDNGW